MRRFSDVFHPVRDIKQVATIMAERPYQEVSNRFSFIPTIKPIEVLADFGWHPVAIAEQRVRLADKRGFQRHAVKFQNPAYTHDLQLHETRPELVMINDHSGLTAFQFLLGLWEKVCINGLIVQRDSIAEQRVLHRGYTADKVANAIATMIPAIPQLLADVDRMRDIKLLPGEANAFAKAAIELRWDGEKYAVNPQAVAYPLRREQKEDSLWNVYNTVQEKILRGGVYIQNLETKNVQKARSVNGLTENLRLNKALFTLADEMAKLKSN